MKNASSIVGLAAAVCLTLTSCTGDGSESGTAEPSASPGEATATESGEAQSGDGKVYSVEELRDLISGLTDEEGNELTLYSEDQVEQGSQIAELLLTTASVDPEECKSIATAGLLDSVEGSEVAVAISESEEPRTVSAQSGEEGPSATELLEEVSGTMEQCGEFTIEAAGQQLEVTSEELDAQTDAEQTFATVSTRGSDESQMLMQVSAAQGRLLVVATKGGADLGDEDQKELEDLVNEVLSKAEGDTGQAPSETESAEPSESPSTEDASGEPSDEATDGATENATDGATEEATDQPTEGTGG
jgi:hypothetical protein